MGAVYALRQPDATGADSFHFLPRPGPEVQRHAAGHIAAEAVHDLRPHFQRIDLVAPQFLVGIIQIYYIPPIRHMAAGPTLLVPEKPLRVGLGQHRVRRCVVVDDVDDALHAPDVDGVHQMAEILHGAVLQVHVPVVTDGVGTAQRALAAHLANRMDRHQPYDIRTQGAQSVQITFQRTEGALRCVVSHEHAVDQLMLQCLIRIHCHIDCLLSPEVLKIRPPSARECPVPLLFAACCRHFLRPPHRWSFLTRSRRPCRPAFRSSPPPRHE